MLIVEDDRILRRMLSITLKEKGLLALEAKNGIKGLDIITQLLVYVFKK